MMLMIAMYCMLHRICEALIGLSVYDRTCNKTTMDLFPRSVTHDPQTIDPCLDYFEGYCSSLCVLIGMLGVLKPVKDLAPTNAKACGEKAELVPEAE